MSEGMIGHGTVLTANDGTNTTTIGNIISITGPDQMRDSVDTSTMNSTEKWKEFLPGMLDAGEITFDVNYESETHASELQTLLTGDPVTFKIEFPDETNTSQTTKSSFECEGFFTALGFAIPLDDKITQSVTIKLTGKPTYTAL